MLRGPIFDHRDCALEAIAGHCCSTGFRRSYYNRSSSSSGSITSSTASSSSTIISSSRHYSSTAAPTQSTYSLDPCDLTDALKVAELIHRFKSRGHLVAQLDPLKRCAGGPWVGPIGMENDRCGMVLRGV